MSDIKYMDKLCIKLGFGKILTIIYGIEDFYELKLKYESPDYPLSNETKCMIRKDSFPNKEKLLKMKLQPNTRVVLIEKRNSLTEHEAFRRKINRLFGIGVTSF